MNLVARYGGDEFIAILTGSDEQDARIHTGRVADPVRNDPELADHGVTLSFGVATVDEEMEQQGDLVRAADRDLYRVMDGRGDREPPRSGR